jgi:dTDP-4-amino-4,6-dideoxygalactose transaminase
MHTLRPRLRLDLSMGDVLIGCALDAEGRARRIAARFSDEGDVLVTLSVRSAFDLFLAEVAWPAGSEVLVSALTIPDMPRILVHHGYVPVPVDVDLDTLVPPWSTLDAAITPRTVGWLHAHLFGTRADLNATVSMLAARGVAVLEDCAQAYTGTDFNGSPGVAASFFSFGTIKTATATGGAIVRVRDAALLGRMRGRMQLWPREPRIARTRKIARTGVLLGLGHPWVYARLVRTLRTRGHDPDAWVHASSRGFPGDDFFVAIRHRPSAPLLALLERRLAQDTARRIARRRVIGESLRAQLPPDVRLLGGSCRLRTHWVFPVICRDPAALRARLRAHGFDATSRSSLIAVAHPDGRTCPQATAALMTLVYVPLPRSRSSAVRNRLGRALSQPEVAASAPPVAKAA